MNFPSRRRRDQGWLGKKTLVMVKRMPAFLFCCLALTGALEAAPWSGAGQRPAPLRAMPQMRVIQAGDLGETLDLRPQLQAGKFNVVDLFAEW